MKIRLARFDASTEIPVAPVKTMFPSAAYFQKGLEFYGQQASRLEEPGYAESIRRTGLWVVEGFNDVLRLDTLGQPALGAMFNRLTEPQIYKLVQFSKRTGAPGITFLYSHHLNRRQAVVKSRI